MQRPKADQCPSLHSCVAYGFICCLFNSFSISSMDGIVPSTFLGYSFSNSYSDIPIGWELPSYAYFAKVLSFDLQINKPIVGLSPACLSM